MSTIEFYPSTVNRSVILVIPKQEFWDWEKNVFPDLESIQDSILEYNSYLINSSGYFKSIKHELKNHWEWIFENELFSICTDETAWPKKRTWNLFEKWFDIKFSTLVFDLEPDILKKEGI